MQQQEQIPAEKISKAPKSVLAQGSDTLFGQEKYPNLQLVKNVASERICTVIITTMESLLMSNGCVPSATAVLTPNERRLIAAAPDMLAALKEYVARCPDCGGTGTCYTHEDETQVGCAPGSSGIDCPGCADQRAAIAKAEGRA